MQPRRGCQLVRGKKRGRQRQTTETQRHRERQQQIRQAANGGEHRERHTATVDGVAGVLGVLRRSLWSVLAFPLHSRCRSLPGRLRPTLCDSPSPYQCKPLLFSAVLCALCLCGLPLSLSYRSPPCRLTRHRPWHILLQYPYSSLRPGRLCPQTVDGSGAPTRVRRRRKLACRWRLVYTLRWRPCSRREE